MSWVNVQCLIGPPLCTEVVAFYTMSVLAALSGKIGLGPKCRGRDDVFLKVNQGKDALTRSLFGSVKTNSWLVQLIWAWVRAVSQSLMMQTKHLDGVKASTMSRHESSNNRAHRQAGRYRQQGLWQRA